MKIVSFYSDIEGTTFYSDKAVELKLNCERLGIEHLILQRNYGTTWLANIQGKPRFIKEMFLQLKEPFIYLDVDSSINSIHFEIKGDWGFVMRPMDGKPYDHVHYISNTVRNAMLIDKWIEAVSHNKLCDHSAFLAVREYFKKIKKDNFFWIPDTCFNIGLGKSKGRTEYLTQAEIEAKNLAAWI